MSTTGARGSSERAGVGARLREARERRNLSLHELAERTKIPAGSLDALENEQTGRLPGGLFARSFVRAFAREVGLDPEEAVRDFVRAHPEHAAPDTEDDRDVEPIENDGSGAVGRMVAVIVAVAVLGAAGFAAYRWLQGQAPGFQAAEGEASRPASRAADNALNAAGASSPATPTSAVAASDSGGPAPPPAPTPTPASNVAAPASAAPAEPVSVAPAGGMRLEIHPRAPCWVRVTADGRVRLERLLQPGERPVVVAADGIELQVGDAGAFDYTINGQRGRPLGPAGRVVRVAIGRDTVSDFVAR